MDITAIQELRLIDNGSQKFSKSVVFYSGTGFVIRQNLLEYVMEFKPINEYISYIRLRGKFYNNSLLSVYTPTEEKNDLTKDTFYDQLERVFVAIPKQNIVLGDFNAKIGREDVFRPTIGKFSVHDQYNDNGRFCNIQLSSDQVNNV